MGDLTIISEKLIVLFDKIESDFNKKDFNNLTAIIAEKQALFDHLSLSIDKQISRIRTEESSPKNTTLYFGILLETKDLISALMNLLELYQEFYILGKDSKKSK